MLQHIRTWRKYLLTSSFASLFVLTFFAVVQDAQAGVFDDDEARRQIKELSTQVDTRLEALSSAQFELVSQIQALRQENALLRGQIETATYELETSKKRQIDFYNDLDGRLRKLEPQHAQAADPKGAESNGERASAPDKTAANKPNGDSGGKTRDYEAALNLFKQNKIKEAAVAFDGFVRSYPNASLTPNAQYWLGNAHYALRDCKKSIEAHKVLVSKWPRHAKVPDSLINIASCQQELGDAKAAKTTLESVVAGYPGSAAAATAKQRLKK